MEEVEDLMGGFHVTGPLCKAVILPAIKEMKRTNLGSGVGIASLGPPQRLPWAGWL